MPAFYDFRCDRCGATRARYRNARRCNCGGNLARDNAVKLIRDMTEPELRDYFSALARKVEAELPPGPSARGTCLFALIVADTMSPGVGQYVSNVQRADMIRLLRETADRLQGREDIPR